MSQRYERLGVVPIEPVMAAIRARMAHNDDPDHHPKVPAFMVVHGVKVHIDNLRMHTFASHPATCADRRCQCQAVHFAVERSLDRKGNVLRPHYHLNLYGRDARGHEILFTHDHILARSLGGADDLTNTQTMCSPCNARKSVGEHAELRRRRLQEGLNPHTGDQWDDSQGLINPDSNAVRKLRLAFETQASLRSMSPAAYRLLCEPKTTIEVPKAPFLLGVERQAATLDMSIAGVMVFLQHQNQYQSHFNRALRGQRTARMEEGVAHPFRDALFEHLTALATTLHQPLDVFRAHLEASAAIQFAGYDPATERSPKHAAQASRLGLSNSALDFFRQAYPRRGQPEVQVPEAIEAAASAPPVEATVSRRRRQP